MTEPMLVAREARWLKKLNLAKSIPSRLVELQALDIKPEMPETAEATLAVLTLRMPAALRCDLRMASQAVFLYHDFLSEMESRGFLILHKEFTLSADGPECYYIVCCNAPRLKRVAIDWESGHRCGELIDLDIMDAECRTLSRRELGYPSRSCFICDRDAVLCSSGRTHSLDIITQRIEEILATEKASLPICATIGRLAVKALLFEVSAFPKPGLVCPESAGAHGDMDYAHFLASLVALAPFFKSFAEIGYSSLMTQATMLKNLRSLGLEAEKVMFKATGGVNTHKGLIFSLGLLCAGAGLAAAQGQDFKPKTICAKASSIVEGICGRELEILILKQNKAAKPTLNHFPCPDSSVDHKQACGLTSGERLFIEYGIRGIRGEAEEGFPSVLNHSLPCLRESLSSGLSMNDAQVNALLSLYTVVEDSNVCARGGLEGLAFLRSEAGKCRSKGAMSTCEGRACIEELDHALKKRNISPGGCADLLALTLFLHAIATE
jgi:holo-ACP synthase/triphosphoribosyl-dephospho-CoA synthase